jgi:hypothetical protein
LKICGEKNDMPDLLSIHERHMELRNALAGNWTDSAEECRKGIGALLRDIERVATGATVEDYLWLRDTLDYWRTAGPVLGVEVETVLEPPPVQKIAQKPVTEGEVWSDRHLEVWLKNRAFDVSKSRALEWNANQSVDEILERYREKNPGQDEHNWVNAEIHLAAAVLDGTIDLVHGMTQKSYGRLEGRTKEGLTGRRWLREVKDLKAYFHWKKRGGGWGAQAADEDYITACEELRNAVKNKDRKASQSAFEPFQQYIAKHFLDENGQLDKYKKRVGEGLDAKAEVIALPWHSKRQAAEEFMRGFYEHITKAVLAPDEDETQEVIQALGLRAGFRHNQEMVNCFEMALGIYFLNAELAAKTMGG